MAAMASASEGDDRMLAPHASALAGISDPSTADGSICVFSRSLPLEVRHSDDHDSTAGTLLSVDVKVLVLYCDDGHTPESVRVELSRENDLFFHMYHSLQERGFSAMQARQKLLASFSDFPDMLLSNLQRCVRDPHNSMAVLNVGFKFVELLSLDFLLTPSDVVKQHIIYRHASLRAQVDQLQHRLHEVNEIVKAKSPSLLLALKKTGLKGSAGSGAHGTPAHANGASAALAASHAVARSPMTPTATFSSSAPRRGK